LLEFLEIGAITRVQIGLPRLEGWNVGWIGKVEDGRFALNSLKTREERAAVSVAGVASVKPVACE
jgi:type II secretory pathway component PulK